jgi:Arc/MetJ family transcription regulator
VSRTTIEIDDKLLSEVMRQHGFKTKREAVNEALRRLYVRPATREEILARRGMGWDSDLEAMRAIRPEVKAWIERD